MGQPGGTAPHPRPPSAEHSPPLVECPYTLRRCHFCHRCSGKPVNYTLINIAQCTDGQGLLLVRAAHPSWVADQSPPSYNLAAKALSRPLKAAIPMPPRPRRHALGPSMRWATRCIHQQH